MLVLSRKVGERIHVGDNIVLEIRRIAGNRVTLALDAPRDVRILRGELEQAAKEFCPTRSPDGVSDEHGPAMAAPAPVRILHSLPAEQVGQHFAT
jgi:carbon storage regulator